MNFEKGIFINFEKISISIGLSSLYVSFIDFYLTKSFEYNGLIMALIFIGLGIRKLSQSSKISSGYITGYLAATSIQNLVLGMILVSYSSPFLIADSVTIATTEIMTSTHWIAFIIGLILIARGLFTSKKTD
tara:strand:- start:362 stop:757 length:396 start_codon:yes stop_codon:yes gene_type:complete